MSSQADRYSLRKIKGVENSLALAAYMSPITPVGMKLYADKD
jgi:hypothetical protein